MWTEHIFMRFNHISISSKADLKSTQHQFHFIFSPLRGFLKSALHHGPGAEVKLASWNQTVNLFPHQLQPLPGILYCDFSTEWTQHSRVIVHLTKPSTYCGMCSQMRSCIVHEINRISQVFIVLFCSSWTNVRQFCWVQLP